MSTQGPAGCTEDVTVSRQCGAIRGHYRFGLRIGVECSCGAKVMQLDWEHNEEWEARRDRFVRQHARETE